MKKIPTSYVDLPTYPCNSVTFALREKILLHSHKFMIVLSPWWIVLWKVWLVLYILAVRLGHLTSSGECTVRRGDMFHLWGTSFMPLFPCHDHLGGYTSRMTELQCGGSLLGYIRLYIANHWDFRGLSS